jgi:hypothetical protein
MTVDYDGLIAIDLGVVVRDAGSTSARSTRACAHDLAAGALYTPDVLLQSCTGQTAHFLGVDFPP